MAIKAYLYLPDTEDTIVNIGDSEEELKQVLRLCFDLIKYIKKEDGNLIYDAKNINDFFTQMKSLLKDELIVKPEHLLRQKLKTGENVNDRPMKDGNCNYFVWDIEHEKIIHANAFLSDILERIKAYPDDIHILFNISNALNSNRPFIAMFKDAVHLTSLPDSFAHIPYISDLEELELWLATHQIKEFSLFDKQRFRRTSGVQQGKAVFLEIENGYYWYMDNFHKNEYEVFDSDRNFIATASLMGELDYNIPKSKRGRTINNN